MLLSYRMFNQESRVQCIDPRQECAVKVAYLKFMSRCSYKTFLFIYLWFFEWKELGTH